MTSEQRGLPEHGTKTPNELLKFYENSQNDHTLTEDDTKIIEESWWKSKKSWYTGPRYFRMQDEEAGKSRAITIDDKSVPVDVENEGFWYSPYRQTFQEIHGQGGIRTEIAGINIARSPMEAINEGKRMAFVASFSDARNCLKTEVLLSGSLKFEGQTEPKWIDVRLITEEEEIELRNTHLEIMKQLGYTPHEE